LVVEIESHLLDLLKLLGTASLALVPAIAAFPLGLGLILFALMLGFGTGRTRARLEVLQVLSCVAFYLEEVADVIIVKQMDLLTQTV
jgi:hypothetical protein